MRWLWCWWFWVVCCGYVVGEIVGLLYLVGFEVVEGFVVVDVVI